MFVFQFFNYFATKCIIRIFLIIFIMYYSFNNSYSQNLESKPVKSFWGISPGINYLYPLTDKIGDCSCGEGSHLAYEYKATLKGESSYFLDLIFLKPLLSKSISNYFLQYGIGMKQQKYSLDYIDNSYSVATSYNYYSKGIKNTKSIYTVLNVSALNRIPLTSKVQLVNSIGISLNFLINEKVSYRYTGNVSKNGAYIRDINETEEYSSFSRRYYYPYIYLVYGLGVNIAIKKYIISPSINIPVFYLNKVWDNVFFSSSIYEAITRKEEKYHYTPIIFKVTFSTKFNNLD